MKLNVGNFQTVLEKATLNFSIESVQLKLTPERIVSKMLMQHSRDAIVLLDVPNDVIELKKGAEYTLNFAEPSQFVMPYLNLIDESEAEVKIFDEKMVITSGKQKSNLFFCAPQVVSVFSGTSPREGLQYFTSFDLDESFIRDFGKIKKIGMRFGNIYFSVEGGKFVMETTDKQNSLSNGIKFDLFPIKDESDLTLCFDYRNVVNLMNVIGGRFTDFKVSFAFIRNQNLGMAYVEKKDGTEKFYLMSKTIN